MQLYKTSFVMHNEENELIGMIYETALDPGLWPVVLDGISELIDQPESTREQQQSFLNQPPRATAFASHQQSNRDELLPMAPLAEQPQQLTHATIDDHQLFELVKPHLQQAMQLRLKHQKVGYKLDMLANILEKIPIGVLVVDRQLQVLFANQLADKLLSEQVGITLVGDRIRIADESEHSLFRQRLIQVCDATNEYHAIPMNLHSERHNEISVLISRLEYTEEILSQDMPAALLFISPPLQHKTLPHDLLKSLYGFTRSETSLANNLIHNKNLKEIASERNVSINTIRNQIGSMFGKTNTHRQSELICRLLNSPSKSSLPENSGKINFKANEITKNISHPNVENQIPLACGRLLGYAEYGDPNGKPVIYCHSIYGSRYEKPYDGNLLEEYGLRLIVPDRPGVGLSDPQIFSGYSDWAVDLKQLTEYLRLDSFSIFGYGTGGNFALAATARLAGLVRNVTAISPTPPLSTLSDLKPLMASHKIAMGLAQKLPLVATQLYSAIYAGAAKNPDRFLTHSLPADDLERKLVCKPEIRQVFLRCLPELAKHGAKGAPQEIRYITLPWDFELQSITQPVYFWRGDLDKHAPEATSRRLFATFPNAEIRRFPHSGHTIFYTEWKSIVKHLACI